MYQGHQVCVRYELNRFNNEATASVVLVFPDYFYQPVLVRVWTASGPRQIVVYKPDLTQAAGE